MFVSTDSFPDAVLARNCSCLLALYHLQPKLPLHQKLPEPYSSMWLKLTGMEAKASKAVAETPSFACPLCDRVFEKEMGFFCCGFVTGSLKVHMKKDHKGEKVPEASPASPGPDAAEEAASLPSASAGSSIRSEKSMTSTHSEKSTASAKAAPVAAPSGRRPVSDHRDSEELRSLSLESRSRFTSKYERMMEEEKRRVAHAQRENRRELREQLSKPPPVLLSEANQQFILSLLRDAGEETTESEPSERPSSTKERALKEELVRLGFPESGAAEAARRCDSVSSCIEWCCVHLEDAQLPPAFRAEGKQFEVKTNARGAGETVVRALVEFGFSPDDAMATARRESTLEKSLSVVCGALLGERFDKDAGRSWETVETEIEALKAIFNMDESAPAVSTETVLGCHFLHFVTTNEEAPLHLFVVLSPLFGYPSRPPVVLLRSESVPDSQRLAFTRCVFRRYKENCEGVLFEVFSDVASLLEQAEKEMASVSRVLLAKSSGVSMLSSGMSSLSSGVSSLSSGVSTLSSGVSTLSSTPSKTPSKRPSKHSTPKGTTLHRVVDKRLLTGTPSAEVVSQRIALPIAQYRSQVLSMIRGSQVSILSGGTGCGKSTQVPQFLLEEFRESQEKNLNVVVCEPRRISCLGLYNRVLEEQGFREGSQCPVGYQVRGDSKSVR